MSSVIPRSKDSHIERSSISGPIRSESEIQSAYEQAGFSPQHNVKSWYRDIYEFYQNNEC